MVIQTDVFPHWCVCKSTSISFPGDKLSFILWIENFRMQRHKEDLLNTIMSKFACFGGGFFVGFFFLFLFSELMSLLGQNKFFEKSLSCDNVFCNDFFAPAYEAGVTLSIRFSFQTICSSISLCLQSQKGSLDPHYYHRLC